MKAPKKPIQKKPSTKPLSKKEYDEEDDLRGKRILDDDDDFDMPLDDLDSFDSFDDDDDDSY
ncbi:MAG: hypothetical protein EOO99_10780 [Pedobacter sp.]|nr:MAG: hypothetical protein EOO99_10780 [Pedobacter sp.]